MKNFATSILTLFASIMTLISYGQELPKVIPPSPTVSNLMQFEEVPISYYTGQPNISVPIYSKALTGDLAVNIGLSYNTQGVQINNNSSWTGTSWSLNAGGTISRTVRGEADEITKATSHNQTGIYHLDDYWNYTDPNVDKAKFNYLVTGDNIDKYDNKPDLFQFNFMGYSGRFIILKEGNTLVPKFISKTGVFKIEFNHNTNYKISDFTVTDTKGYVYTFDVIEISDTTPFTGTKTQNPSSTFNVSTNLTGYPVNSAWHLSKVETSNGSLLMTIAYQAVTENYAVSTTNTTSKIANYGIGYNALVSNSYNQGILEPAESYSYQSILSITQKISEINFTRDNIQVQFNIDAGYTHPETGGRTLDKIKILDISDINNIIENKQYQFNYEETIDNSQIKRLWLMKVTETAGSISHDYSFQYTNKQDLPGFNKDDIRGDSWGYYSGINVGSYSCSPIIYSDEIVQTGLLKSIEYPTGGFKEFDFEHNSYSYYQDELIGIEDYRKNPRNTNVLSDFTDDFEHNNQQYPGGTVAIDTLTLDYEQNIFVSSWIEGDDSSPAGYLNDYMIRIHGGNNFERYVVLNEQCTMLSNIPAGTYEVELAPYNNLTTADYTIKGDFRVTYSQLIANPKQEMIGGGVRIKEIRFMDNLLVRKPVKRITYEYNAQTNDSLSSGVIDSNGDRLERTYLKDTDRYLFGTSDNSCGAFISTNIKYAVIEKGVNVEFSQGSYVGYRHVKAYETGNGSSTYSYTSPYDYPSADATFDFEQPKPKENLDYKRGLLLEQITFNQSKDTLKIVSYKDINGDPNYELQEDLLFIDRSVFRPNCSLLQLFTDWSFYNSGTVQNQVPSETPGINCPPPTGGTRPCGEFPPIPREFYSGWAKLKGTTTKDYFYDGATTLVKESRQENTYNSLNYQISNQDSFYDEGGIEQHLETKYYYPVGISLDSNTQTIKDRLVDLNKVNEVLEIESYKNSIKLNETNNIYFEFATDQVLPEYVKASKGNDTPEPRINFHKYDEYGNPLEVSKTNGIRIIYVWGYNDTKPIAKIINHSYDNISSSLLILINDAKTASNIDNDIVSENVLKTKLDDLRSHPDLVNAQISTYTYDPLIGITSVKDTRDYSMTYYYDDFNRLKYVKDKQGNILSQNEYNYKNQY